MQVGASVCGLVGQARKMALQATGQEGMGWAPGCCASLSLLHRSLPMILVPRRACSQGMAGDFVCWGVDFR